MDEANMRFDNPEYEATKQNYCAGSVTTLHWPAAAQWKARYWCNQFLLG